MSYHWVAPIIWHSVFLRFKRQAIEQCQPHNKPHLKKRINLNLPQVTSLKLLSFSSLILNPARVTLHKRLLWPSNQKTIFSNTRIRVMLHANFPRLWSPHVIHKVFISSHIKAKVDRLIEPRYTLAKKNTNFWWVSFSWYHFNLDI